VVIIMPVKNTPDKFWEKVDRLDGGCWEWVGHKLKFGYGHAYWSGKLLLAHRLSWMLTNGEIPRGMCVLHKCDNPGCVNPSHLFLGTYQDNATDKVAKGRCPKGTSVYCAKLTDGDVLSIREKYRPFKFGLRKLAKIYGVGETTIFQVIHNGQWKHVAGKIETISRSKNAMPVDFCKFAIGLGATMSITDIANHYQVNPGTISNWMRMCGIPKRYDAIDKSEIAALLRLGKSARQIMDMVGCSYATVSRQRTRMKDHLKTTLKHLEGEYGKL
jgi:hypothetical protein